MLVRISSGPIYAFAKLTRKKECAESVSKAVLQIVRTEVAGRIFVSAPDVASRSVTKLMKRLVLDTLEKWGSSD